MNRLTRIRPGFHLGENAYFLDNDILRLAVLPERGANIASLRHLATGRECLFQPSGERYAPIAYGMDFSAGSCAGIDDAFPAIDAEVLAGPDGPTPIPDHGELWSIPWQVREWEPGVLSCRAAGRVLPYTIARDMRLRDNSAILQYRISNTGSQPLYGLWAFHGLWAVDDATRWELATPSVVLAQPHDRLGLPGTVLDFPDYTAADGSTYLLDRMGRASDTLKYYQRPEVSAGAASLILGDGVLRLDMRWPAEVLPYLGVWVNNGGFKNERNIALEPSNGYYDSISRARANNRLRPIAPGGEISFSITLTLETIV